MISSSTTARSGIGSSGAVNKVLKNVVNKRIEDQPAPMKFLFLVSFMCCVALAVPHEIRAQSSQARLPAGSGRYLLIVETSRSMEKEKDGVLDLVSHLLASGMNGQLRRGDTLGLWTFNDALYAGRFPLQQWLPDGQKDITGKALAFLREQKYEKNGNLAPVLLSLGRIVKDSPFLTVILISDGTAKIKGTPFDEKINEYYQLWRAEQQKARMPFATVLRAQAGKITDYSVTSAPWQVELPALPPEMVAARNTEKIAVVPKPAPVPAPVVAPTPVPPLIISGKKPAPIAPPVSVPQQPQPLQPSNAATVAPAVSAAPIPAARPAPANATTGAVGTLASPPLAPEPAVVKKTPEPATNAGTRDFTSAASANPTSTNMAADTRPANLHTTTNVAAAHGFFTRTRVIWLAGSLLVVLLVAIAGLMSRRPRESERASLITHSLDREKE